MAQKSYILDLGSYSAKRIVFGNSLTGHSIASSASVPAPSMYEPRPRRADQVKAAKELLPTKRLAADSVGLVFPAERILNRSLELPFAERNKLDQVLGFELENHVPLAVEDMVFDYLVLERTRTGSKLFVSVVSRKDMDELVETMSALNIDPRAVVHPGMSLGLLADLLPEKHTGSVALVDLGHRKTTITIVQGKRVLATRVSAYAGLELTRALAEDLSVDMAEAEREKHSAHLFPAGEGTAVGRVQQIADCLKQHLGTVVRDIHQTIRGAGGVERVYLTGGSAELGGIDEFMGSALGSDVVILRPSGLKLGRHVSVADTADLVPVVACGYATGGVGPTRRINFRQGAYGYVGDIRFLKGRLIYLSIIIPAILSMFLIPKFLEYATIQDKQALVEQELVALSEKVLGEPLTDAEEIMVALEEAPPPDVWTVFPDMTAPEIYWAVVDIASSVHGRPVGTLGNEAAPVPAEPSTGTGPGGELDGALPQLPGARPGPKSDSPFAVAPASPALVPGGPAPGQPAGTGPTVGPPALPSIKAAGGADGTAATVSQTPGIPGAGTAPTGGGTSDNPDGTAALPAELDIHKVELSSFDISAPSQGSLGVGSVQIEGMAARAATIELLQNELARHPCFKGVQPTKQERMKTGATSRDGWFKFTMTWQVNCPDGPPQPTKPPEKGANKGSASVAPAASQAVPGVSAVTPDNAATGDNRASGAVLPSADGADRVPGTAPSNTTTIPRAPAGVQSPGAPEPGPASAAPANLVGSSAAATQFGPAPGMAGRLPSAGRPGSTGLVRSPTMLRGGGVTNPDPGGAPIPGIDNPALSPVEVK